MDPVSMYGMPASSSLRVTASRTSSSGVTPWAASDARQGSRSEACEVPCSCTTDDRAALLAASWVGILPDPMLGVNVRSEQTHIDGRSGSVGLASQERRHVQVLVERRIGLGAHVGEPTAPILRPG